MSRPRIFQLLPLLPRYLSASSSIVPLFFNHFRQLTSMIASDHTLAANAACNSLPSTQPDIANSAVADLSLTPFASPEDAAISLKYRPFLMDESIMKNDWVSQLELRTVMKMAHDDLLKTGKRLRILVLYGSLRKRSYSKLLALEAARIFHRLGCDVRVYDPAGLPIKDDVQHDHPKVVELRGASQWSDGHFWVSPEQHGNLTAVFKNQIDWIPLSTGSVRPTQGRTLGIAMVSGGSQSFNTVNSLRVLGRWMRMFTIPNQSSVPIAYEKFTDEDAPEGGSRLMPGSNRDRLVDCVEEMVKYSIIMREHFDLFNDRFSERRAAENSALESLNSSGKDVVNGVNIKAI
ncbi:Flavoprotein-like protein [Elaphomyces granulatus]